MHTATDEPVARLDAVRRVYRGGRGAPSRIALDGLTLHVPRGCWLALLGPNGAGKSTAVRILATLDAPDEGSVSILGLDPRRSASTIRARIGVAFQSSALDPLLTIRENLRIHAALYAMPDRDAAIGEALARASLADRADDRVRTLSGGLARRADLARALLTGPDLLLIDEPTAGLDHEARARFLDDLDGARAGRSRSIVMSTHLMDEAERADLVALLDRGRLVALDSPAALRAALGPSVLRTGPEAKETLRAAGVEASCIGELLIASPEPEPAARAAEALVRAHIPFTFAPPTLGDVYLERTGRPLDDAGPAGSGGDS